MNYPDKIKARDLRGRMGSSDAPLLVLAYEDDKSFRAYGVDGAIPFSEFQAQLPSLPKEREIVFYCA